MNRKTQTHWRRISIFHRLGMGMGMGRSGVIHGNVAHGMWNTPSKRTWSFFALSESDNTIHARFECVTSMNRFRRVHGGRQQLWAHNTWTTPAVHIITIKKQCTFDRSNRLCAFQRLVVRTNCNRLWSSTKSTQEKSFMFMRFWSFHIAIASNYPHLAQF